MLLASLPRRNSRIVNSTSSGLSSTRRISTSCDMHLLLGDREFRFLLRFVFGQSDGEEKRCSLIDLRFRPNTATVFPNDALHDRQADSCAFEITSLVQPLKNSKKLPDILHLEAHPVVADKYNALAVVPHLSHLNHGVFSLPCVLHGIGEQVYEDLLDQSRIAFRAEQVSDLPLYVPACAFRRQVLDHLP